MGFIDFIVNRSFRDEKEGRVVVFNGVGRGQVALAPRPMDRAQRIALAVIGLLVLMIAFTILVLVRAR